MRYTYCCAVYILNLLLLAVHIGSENSELRIIGGKNADEEKYAYIVRLQHIKTFLGAEPLSIYFHVCTGAVITPIWTLTAAHCLELKGPETINDVQTKPVIRFGSVKEAWSSPVREVILAIEHPGYRQNNLVMFTLDNDIGLVKTEPIELKEYARVSSLDFVSLFGQEVTLTGYGLTNASDGYVDDATEIGKPLQMLHVLATQCNKEKVKMYPAVCIVRQCSQSSGICPGDSGGPMLHPSGVAGVNSLGPVDLDKFCALKLRRPSYDVAVITPTSPYIDWITEIINTNT